MNVTSQTQTDFESSSQLWTTSTTEVILRVSPRDAFVGDEINRFSRSLLTFAAVTTIIIMLVGIFGNLLTILALLKCPKVRNVAAAFIISLCFADCLFCAVVLPFSAFRFIQGTWTHGDFLCRLIPFIQYGNIGVSLLCIAMITINRYIMIAHHSAYAKIYKRHWIGVMIAFCWLFAYGMQLPTLFGIWGRFGYDSRLGTCSIMSDENGNSSKTALFMIAFVIPCIIIIGCYTKIFWVVHMSEVRLRQHANKQNSIPNNLREMPSTVGSNGTSNRMSSPVSSSSFSTTSAAEITKTGISQKIIRVKDQRDVKAKRNEWRITKMVLAIFLSFIVCYLPITVVKIADKDVYSPGLHILGYIMLYLSSCINPIIYVIMNKQYRKAYKTVLMCQPSRLLPFTNVGSSAGEKWKDIRCSYNHSRTIVSQVSVIDQQTSSNSYSSNQSPVVLELSLQTLPPPSNSTNKPPTAINSKTMTTNTSSDPISPITKTPMEHNFPNLSNSTPNNNQHQVINQNSTVALSRPPVEIPQQMQPQVVQQQQLFTKPQDTTRFPDSRITFSEGDIIVEEEEVEVEKLDQTCPNPFLSNSLESSEMSNQMHPNLSEIEKHPQYINGYKRNINDIPDNNTKVISKTNILRNC
ncbi:G-protein coupled receptor moody [Episyrphus balteatus]|uniref:G-protein coupled receptor moody n=1 Tax=Episyrphus balteatus TaxID=286459 RepID=UPI00248679EA|nr:G-protein coupled receptor moody [Episyrphus balteatus]XP_055844570.1 G-protein coupled receptor moody [Episyrphus balteatus]